MLLPYGIPRFPTRSAGTPSSFGSVCPPNPEVEDPPLAVSLELDWAGAGAELVAGAELLAVTEAAALFSGTDGAAAGATSATFLSGTDGAGIGAAPL